MTGVGLSDVATDALPGTTAGDVERFRPDLEGLRAVAILLVLLYHAGLPWRVVLGGHQGV